MLVSEAAQRDRGRRAVVLRASKMMSISNWSGGDYRPSVGTPEEVDRLLERVGAGYLLIDLSLPPERTPLHHRLLLETVKGNPAWERIASLDLVRRGRRFPGSLEIYRRKGVRVSPEPFRIDTRYSFGRDILSKPR
jgi:hypothetical protein